VYPELLTLHRNVTTRTSRKPARLLSSGVTAVTPCATLESSMSVASNGFVSVKLPSANATVSLIAMFRGPSGGRRSGLLQITALRHRHVDACIAALSTAARWPNGGLALRGLAKVRRSHYVP